MLSRVPGSFSGPGTFPSPPTGQLRTAIFRGNSMVLGRLRPTRGDIKLYETCGCRLATISHCSFQGGCCPPGPPATSPPGKLKHIFSCSHTVGCFSFLVVVPEHGHQMALDSIYGAGLGCVLHHHFSSRPIWGWSRGQVWPETGRKSTRTKI